MTDYRNRMDAVDRSVQLEIENSVESLHRQRSPLAQSRILSNFAHKVRQLERHNVLMCLMTVEDVAEHFDVTVQRIRAKAKWLEERGHSAGMKVGRDWIFHPEELPNLEPLPAGRPRKERDD
jgi:predicted transcriptional regulator